MNNVTFVTMSDDFGNEYTHAIIENADGGFTSMPKAVYEAQQVEHLTEIPTGAEKL